MSKPPISRADILQALDESRAERDQQLDAVLLGGTHHLRPLTISDRLRERHGGSSQTADWLDAVNTSNTTI